MTIQTVVLHSPQPFTVPVPDSQRFPRLAHHVYSKTAPIRKMTHFSFATYTCDPVTAGCHITMAGRPSRASAIAAHPEQCTDNDKTAAVRCCDANGGGFSPGCQKLDYEGAAAHCASTQGRRLCTKGELDQTKGSGCGFDNRRTWTSSTQEGSTSQFL